METDRRLLLSNESDISSPFQRSSMILPGKTFFRISFFWFVFFCRLLFDQRLLILISALDVGWSLSHLFDALIACPRLCRFVYESCWFASFFPLVPAAQRGRMPLSLHRRFLYIPPPPFQERLFSFPFVSRSPRTIAFASPLLQLLLPLLLTPFRGILGKWE